MHKAGFSFGNPNPRPVAVAAPIAPFCGCTTVNLNGTGSTAGMNYQWTSLGGTVIDSANVISTTATLCTPDVFTLTVTDPITGCADTANVAAVSQPKPAAVATVTPSLICNGASTLVFLNGTGSSTAGGPAYLWSSSPLVPIDSMAIITTATVTGTTIFYLTVISGGCDSTVTDTVNVYPQPTFTASPITLCTSSPFITDTLSVNGAAPGIQLYLDWHTGLCYSLNYFSTIAGV